MKIGVVARCDRRGLGLQSYELFRNLPVSKVLIVLMGVDRTNNRPLSPFPQHPEWYDDAPWSRRVVFNAGEPEPISALRDFLRGLDVVYVAETPYWYIFYDIARKMGVRTVCHVNPEFFKHASEPKLPRPDAFWVPTPWIADTVPDARVLHFPVNRDHLPYTPRIQADTFLHVVGRRAARDRNGTMSVYKAFRRVRKPCTLVLRSQDPLPTMNLPRQVNLRIHVEDVADHAELYREADVLVYPRRYGGNSLVLNEALSCGLPVLMPDCSPQNSFLPDGMLVPARRAGHLRSQNGQIAMHEADYVSLTQRVHQLIDNPQEVEQLSKQADRLAQDISWEVMRDVYLKALAEVVAQ